MQVLPANKADTKGKTDQVSLFASNHHKRDALSAQKLSPTLLLPQSFEFKGFRLNIRM